MSERAREAASAAGENGNAESSGQAAPKGDGRCHCHKRHPSRRLLWPLGNRNPVCVARAARFRGIRSAIPPSDASVWPKKGATSGERLDWPTQGGGRVSRVKREDSLQDESAVANDDWRHKAGSMMEE
jgi:hypothetical protein